jgi:hypothetical protein
MTLIIEIVLRTSYTFQAFTLSDLAICTRYDLNTAGMLLAVMSRCKMFLDTSAAKVADDSEAVRITPIHCWQRNQPKYVTI